MNSPPFALHARSQASIYEATSSLTVPTMNFKALISYCFLGQEVGTKSTRYGTVGYSLSIAAQSKKYVNEVIIGLPATSKKLLFKHCLLVQHEISFMPLVCNTIHNGAIFCQVQHSRTPCGVSFAASEQQIIAVVGVVGIALMDVYPRVCSPSDDLHL